MATQVVLVRHGLTDWNEQGRLLGRSETPLNQRGHAQARALGEALRGLRPGEIRSSPQRRTVQTAEAIAAACGLTVTQDDRLAEIWLRGWQGKTFAELRDDADVHAYLRDPFHTSDEIEPLLSVRARIGATIEDLREHPRDAPVVLVSHGDPLRILVGEILGLPPGEFRRFAVDNGSASLARIGRKRAHLQLLNWLPGDLRFRDAVG
jgi:broad specificity phosphatase PhoE